MKTGVLMITHKELIDVSESDYTNENGFFFHVTGKGAVKYCLLNDADAAAVTITFSAQETFVLPELCRKIFSSGTTATGIYIGTGPSI